MAEEKWVPFFFDGNAHFGEITSPEEWKKALADYQKVGKNVQLLMERARRLPNDVEKYGKPMFGFYAEYTGPETLGEWAAKEDINLDIAF